MTVEDLIQFANDSMIHEWLGQKQATDPPAPFRDIEEFKKWIGQRAKDRAKTKARTLKNREAREAWEARNPDMVQDRKIYEASRDYERRMARKTILEKAKEKGLI